MRQSEGAGVKANPLSGSGSRREHSWDALRALLMLLGIPYHAALSYRIGQPWIVNSHEGAPGLPMIADAIHLFRMPGFFVIAGYFAALLLARREPGDWLRDRFRRLGVPFVVSLLVLVPVLNIACELSNFALPQAMESWKFNSARSGGYWVRHLWFLIVLLYCSSAAALAVHLWPSLRRASLPSRIDGWVARHFTLSLLLCCAVIGLWQGAAIELFYMAGLATNLPQQILRIDDLISSAPYFLLGCLICRARLTLERIRRFSPAAVLVAAVAAAAWLAFASDLWPPTGRFIATFAAISATQILIATAQRLWNRPIPLVQRFVAASFVIYLFHLPILAILVVVGQPLAIPPLAKAIAVTLLTLGLSYAAWLAISRSRVLSFLFSGERLRPKSAG